MENECFTIAELLSRLDARHRSVIKIRDILPAETPSSGPFHHIPSQPYGRMEIRTRRECIMDAWGR